MLTASLVAHPDTPCPPVRDVRVELLRKGANELTARYIITGDIAALAIPPTSAPARREGLWKHTCCELFVREQGSDNYFELNFSPSTEWAVYAFSAYRHQMTEADLGRDPGIVTSVNDNELRLEASFLLPAALTTAPAGALILACTSVIETRATAVSYWALAHAAGPPDFHHAEGFRLSL
jgi:hypothetical protein